MISATFILLLGVSFLSIFLVPYDFQMYIFQNLQLLTISYANPLQRSAQFLLFRRVSLSLEIYTKLTQSRRRTKLACTSSTSNQKNRVHKSYEAHIPRLSNATQHPNKIHIEG